MGFEGSQCVNVGDADNRGGYECVRTGGIWEISAPSPQLRYKPQITLKK